MFLLLECSAYFLLEQATGGEREKAQEPEPRKPLSASFQGQGLNKVQNCNAMYEAIWAFTEKTFPTPLLFHNVYSVMMLE